MVWTQAITPALQCTTTSQEETMHTFVHLELAVPPLQLYGRKGTTEQKLPRPERCRATRLYVFRSPAMCTGSLEATAGSPNCTHGDSLLTYRQVLAVWCVRVPARVQDCAFIVQVALYAN